ncbi:hypothetical protein SLA2020_348420 [Shorea laevis]
MEAANRMVSKVADASPSIASGQGSLRVAAFIMKPEESLRTAAATAKLPLTATSKLPLTKPTQGGHQREGRAAALQAATWKSKEEEICLTAWTGSGLELHG